VVCTDVTRVVGFKLKSVPVGVLGPAEGETGCQIKRARDSEKAWRFVRGGLYPAVPCTKTGVASVKCHVEWYQGWLNFRHPNVGGTDDWSVVRTNQRQADVRWSGT